MIKFLIILVFLIGCQSINIPSDFVYKEITTHNFNVATWQKITNPKAIYKVYIEGDGNAFNLRGKPTNNPTPRSLLVRELAFGDKNENVIYMARPCQYIQSQICSKRHWTTARFSQEIVNAQYDALKQIVGNSSVVLIGFSGGAQIAGLISTAKSGLNIKKVITIAGNLDHLAWTQYHKLPPLNESLNLKNYQIRFKQIPQFHYVGSNDKVIPPDLVKNFVGNDDLVLEIKGATHNHGWRNIYNEIRNEK